MPAKHHTISHADRLYAGAVRKDGDTSTAAGGRDDGNRGIEMSHIYVHEYGAIAAKDADGIVCSQVITTASDFAAGANLLMRATGVLALAGSPSTATFALDVPRNIQWTASAGTPVLNIIGKDMYGETMVERITITGAGTFSSGIKAFQWINRMYVTAAATTISIGTGDIIGLPYHLSSKTKLIGLYVDGGLPSSVGGSTLVTLTTGLALATDSTSSELDPDVRGTWKGLTGSYVPDGTRVFSAVMVVDHKSQTRAYGVPQATAIT